MGKRRTETGLLMSCVPADLSSERLKQTGQLRFLREKEVLECGERLQSQPFSKRSFKRRLPVKPSNTPGTDQVCREKLV